MPRRWMRITALALLFIALGAITTTAAAWGIALTRTWDRSVREVMTTVRSQPRGEYDDVPAFFAGLVYWPADHEHGRTELRTERPAKEQTTEWNATHVIFRDESPYSASRLAKVVNSAPNRHVPMRSTATWAMERHYGWPARSHWFYSEANSYNVTTATHCEGLIRFPQQIDASIDSRASNGIQPDNAPKSFWLPIYILPLGFTFNTLFYAAAWFIPLFGIRAARRSLRRRRGLCTRCAYDLNGLAPGAACPECGQAPSNAAQPAA